MYQLSWNFFSNYIISFSEMAFGKYLSAVAFIALVILSFEETCALKCWRCQSSGKNGKFCNDPFDANAVTPEQKRWAFVNCPTPAGSNQKSVCRKMTQLVNEITIVSRSCYFEKESASKNDCMNDNTPSYVKTETCETCSYDGCNGEI
ncbi:uncharacterized protein LOC116343375 [Contarinia nasturtii]|uniref:uncharacterized protein LOC116343375 n=1 Tax=Contarinia nasturtii TaxID=265458 RepID=UPI0012D394AF|nr:uncharacterized protein LOC116343375 [Contarinia nasturtii]